MFNFLPYQSSHEDHISLQKLYLAAMWQLGSYLGSRSVEHIPMPSLAHLW